MPSVCLIIGALFIKACAHWYQLQDANHGKCNVIFKTLFYILFF